MMVHDVPIELSSTRKELSTETLVVEVKPVNIQESDLKIEVCLN